MAAGIVLDSSALLASLFGEPGAVAMDPLLGRAAMSAVNYAEVIGVLARRGVATTAAAGIVDAINLMIVPWTQDLAREGCDLSELAWKHGLSLADRACLATARHLRKAVLTADRAWLDLPDLGIEIRMIR